MAELQQRNYYKIFTGTNQAGGLEKIHLGYEADTTEIVLKKDETTSFHMPYFANVQQISNSTLIADGATAGPIPALADRIFQKQANYGETTPWGTSSDKNDGQWLCSWLYALSTESPVWLDRYYNPGRLAYKEALEGNANFTDYISNENIYYDIPSNIKFEPGVLYQYFHHGELTALKNINTFAGVDKTHLRLDIDDWSTLKDNSIYNNTVVIDNFSPDWVVGLFDPGYQDRNSLSFNNKNFINCYVPYNNTFALKNEFTLSFWVYNDDWSQATSTQLIGNLRDGGYGVFFNNLNYNPYYVIPETTYGHFFYFNQEGNIYTDKNNQIILGEPANFSFIGLNSNTEVIGVETNKRKVIKYNHLGDIIAYGMDSNGLLELEGTPKYFVLSGNDDAVFVTTLSTYIFDKDLVLKTTTPQPYGYNEQLAFNTDGVLVRELSCLDLKFDSYNQKWTISTTGSVLCNNTLLTAIPPGSFGTNLAIDPENNLWILADSNKIYKVDTKHKTILNTYEVGVQTSDIDNKNIGFINFYNRETNTFTWYAIIYHNFEQTLYQVTLDGKIYKNTFLPPKLNILDPVTINQDKNLLTFTSKGDFTGYEYRRIFNKAIFKNKSQLQFKVATELPNRNLPPSIFTLSVPTDFISNKVWHHIAVVLKNDNINFYINNTLRGSLQLPSNANFNYEFKNNLFIGCPTGKAENLNKEIASKSVIWNGYIDSIKIYDYPIKSEFIKYFLREKTIADNMYWNIQTAALQYVEGIDRFFKHDLPGSKSAFFNIKINGSGITDNTIKQRLENEIKSAVLQIKPAYAELLKVEWVD